MDPQQITLIVSHALTSVIGLSVACFIWRHRREAPGAYCLALAMVGILIWALSEGIEFWIGSPSLKIWCSKISYIGINLIGPAWFFFALHFRGRSDRVTWNRILLSAIIPVILIALVFTNEYHLLVWPRIDTIERTGYVLMRYEHGPLFWLNLVYCYVFLFSGAILVIRQALGLPRLYRIQSWTLICAAFIPWITSLIYVMRLGPFPEVDLTPMALAISGLMISWNLFTLRLLDIVPIAHEVLFRELPDAVLVTDSRSRVVNLNTAAEIWFGISANSVIGSPLGDILIQSPAILEHFERGEGGIFEEPTNGLSDGRWIDARIKFLTNRHHQAVGKILLLRDVTKEHQALEALHEMEVNLERSRRIESMGVLAGGVAHDFNNLLLGIMGNIELLLMDPALPEKHGKGLQAALNATQRAAVICQQMLAFSGKGRFMIRKVDLNQVTLNALQSKKISIPANIEVCNQFEESLPLIEGDPNQIQQAITNLLLNAVESIGNQAGKLTLSTGVRFCDREYLSSPWLFQGLPEGNYVFIEVSDTGCGVNPEIIPRIFDPFYTTKFIGRGLGLPAVLGIARGHGGTIKVQSEIGTGSSFQLLFPVVI